MADVQAGKAMTAAGVPLIFGIPRAVVVLKIVASSVAPPIPSK